MLLSIEVNSISKAKRISQARKGFYETFYGLNGKKFYVVFYKTKSALSKAVT